MDIKEIEIDFLRNYRAVVRRKLFSICNNPEFTNKEVYLTGKIQILVSRAGGRLKVMANVKNDAGRLHSTNINNLDII
jgi:hypothetical protein